jgi:stage III sporulation protein SpoIIIAA
MKHPTENNQRCGFPVGAAMPAVFYEASPRPEDLAMTDLDRLLEYLPARIAMPLVKWWPNVVEVALEVGQLPVARLSSGPLALDVAPVSHAEVDTIVAAWGDRRASGIPWGIDGTLHRLDPINDRTGRIVGISVRIGRHLTGVAEPLRQLLLGTRHSIVLIGPPGSGKTTILRDCARVLAGQFGSGVLIIDSHNEIGGHGAVPHPAIGCASRFRVPVSDTTMETGRYHGVLEAVRTHAADVVMVDDVATHQDADAILAIAYWGARIIAGVSADTLIDLMIRTELSRSLEGPGSKHTVRGTQRHDVWPSIVQSIVEIRPNRMFAIYHNVGSAMVTVLAGGTPEPDLTIQMPQVT